MRKLITVFLSILLIVSLPAAASAAPDGPVITLQPQSPNYPQYSVAIYTVKAEGSNLHATWYMEWLGKTYNISSIGGAMQDWESFAGEAYGSRKLDDNTFAFIFEGIEYDLDGAYIWCVIEDGHYDVTSQKARISVGNENTPPTIVSIPAELTVEQGASAEIRCVAQAPAGTQLTFLWFETDTGRMEDMRAVNRGTETADYLFCDTGWVGTRNYLCLVETSNGGLAYSSIVRVTVTEKQYVPEPPSIQTNFLQDAQVGRTYSAKIVSTDPQAEYFLYFNPGGANEFDLTGLTLMKDGTITGVPKNAGTFSFCVCAAGAGGEDYMNYALTVRPAPTEAPTEAPTVPSAATEGQEPEPQKPDAPTAPAEPETPTDPQTPETEDSSPKGFPWWSLLLVGWVCACAGVVVAIILIEANKKHSKWR